MKSQYSKDLIVAFNKDFLQQIANYLETCEKTLNGAANQAHGLGDAAEYLDLRSDIRLLETTRKGLKTIINNIE